MKLKVIAVAALIGTLAMESGAQDRSDAVARLTQSVENMKAQNAELRAQVDRLTASLDGVIKENGRLREFVGSVEARLAGALGEAPEGPDGGKVLPGLRSKPWVDDMRAMDRRFAARLAVLEARVDALYGRKPTPAGTPSTSRIRSPKSGSGNGSGAGSVRPGDRPRSSGATGTDRKRADARDKRQGEDAKRKAPKARPPKGGSADARKGQRPS